jgi:hypothetical protein
MFIVANDSVVVVARTTVECKSIWLRQRKVRVFVTSEFTLVGRRGSFERTKCGATKTIAFSRHPQLHEIKREKT